MCLIRCGQRSCLTVIQGFVVSNYIVKASHDMTHEKSVPVCFGPMPKSGIKGPPTVKFLLPKYRMIVPMFTSLIGTFVYCGQYFNIWTNRIKIVPFFLKAP